MAASSARTWWIVPPSRLGTATVAIQPGKWRGTSFTKNPLPSMPWGKLCRASGRPRTCGTMTSATLA